MRAKNTISIGRNSRRFIKCFRLSGNTTGTIEKGREKKKREGERERDPRITASPLNDAKKDRTGFLRRPEARPCWPVSIEIRTCASRPRTRLWPLDTGGPVVEIEREGKKREGGEARIFVHPLCNKCLGPGRRCCLFASTNFLRGLWRWKPMTSLFSHGWRSRLCLREERTGLVYVQVVPSRVKVSF